ncbi:MAG: TonB-dependent receptor domain-containing protein [Rhizomicrobium sp.]
MTVLRSISTIRSAAIINALLVSTALTTPAFAQIETVIVTAEKKAEDIQTVPIAITALSGNDLKTKQISQFKDLQFNVPNMTFTKDGLGSGQIHIRGIGPGFFSPGVAQYQDGVYTETADLATGQYYDIQSLEVLRGPQGTLYGRGSVGGAITVNSAKPDLDNYAVNAEASYGEYNTINSDGMVNMPLIQGQLGLRLAASFGSHDAFTRNIGSGGNYNSLNDYSGRASLRWEPTENTTLDVVGSYFNEADSRTRIDNTECLRDPTGVMGCLPTGLALQPVNTYSRTDALFDSVQFFQSIGALTGETLGSFIYGTPSGGAAGLPALLAGYGAISPAQYAAAVADNTFGDPAHFLPYLGILAGGYAAQTGLAGITNVAIANGPQSGASTASLIPQDLLKVNSSAKPQTRAIGFSVNAHLHQQVTDWLEVDVLAGHRENNENQFGSYTTQPDENVAATLNAATANLFNLVLPIYPGNTAARIASLASTFFGQLDGAGNQLIPLSNPVPGGSINLNSVGVRNYSNSIQVNDKTFNESHENSIEMRFQTDFTGPFNTTIGLFHWERESPIAAYRVMFNGGDYGAAVLGQTFGSLLSSNVALLGQDPMYYQQAPTHDRSDAIFADATYILIPDLLTVKAGVRWSEDLHTLTNNTASFVALNPGTTGPTCLGGAFCFLPVNTSAASAAATEAAAVANYPGALPISKDTSLIDYRGVVEYKPKLDFTDQTFIYASISRGSKPGNANLVPATAPKGAIPQFYQPEELSDYEIGLKNSLLDGQLQANLTGWYYDYKNFQYPSVAYSTSFTQNLNARMWGGEMELIWQPIDDLVFNANFTDSDSSIGNSFAVDQRNPIAGQANGIYIKDTVLTTTGDVPGQTCAIYNSTGNGLSPAEDPAVTAAYALAGQTNPFIAPAGAGTLHQRVTQLSSYGVAAVNFGVCGSNNVPILASAGYYYYGSGPTITPGSSPSGFARPLRGNPVPDLPGNTITVGAQYTFHFDGYTLVPRLDYYWQSGLQQRVFNDPADNIASWDQLNLQITLNSPDSTWFLKVFATNVMDSRNIQGQGLQSDTSGLATNVFLEDPRVVGVTLGGRF